MCLPVCLRAPAVKGVLRIAVSQLDGDKMYLNGSASWVVDDFNDKVPPHPPPPKRALLPACLLRS